MKIDIYPHILPAKYREALYKAAPSNFYTRATIDAVPTLYDLEYRFRIMDKFEGLTQVLTLSSPAVEAIVDPKKAVDLARLANDEMAELVLKYPDRFQAAVACLPMNDIDAALDEVDRAIKDLNFKGIQIYTPTTDKPLDSPEFMPFYAKMSEYNLPIWMHPMRTPEYADYRTESQSKYGIYLLLGWPYETAVAMMRLVLSGVLEKYPNLKIITHHCGSMVPFFEQRLEGSMGRTNLRTGWDSQLKLSKEPINYFKMFYNDTALCGSTPGLMCGYAFFGADHMLFGTDMPYDTEKGERNTRLTIKSIEQMDIPDAEKKKIFAGNAKKLLRLR